MGHTCHLCGARTDGRERLGTHCPGERCGTDLRAGDEAGVQAWCEPARQRGEPGRVSTVRLLVRNAGRRPDGYRVETVEPPAGRLEWDEAALAAPLAPGEYRSVEVRYTPPRDRAATGLDIASRFGVPGTEELGRAHDARSDRFGVALRVLSDAGQGAACAAFAIDVPGRVRVERDGSDPSGAGRRGRPLPKLIGASALAVVVILTVAVGVHANNGADASTETGAGGAGGVGTSFAAPTGESGGSTSPRAPATGGGSAGGGTSTRPGPTRPGAGKSSSDPSRPGQPPGGGPAGGGSTPPPKVADSVVPRTVDLTGTAAKDLITKAGLVPRVEVVPNSRGPEGVVITSEPAAGTTVATGSTVTIRVRDAKTQVPPVAGLSEEDARTRIRAAGLLPTFTRTKTPDSRNYGKALRTDPAAGTSVTVLTAVTVHLGIPDIR